MNRVTIAGLGLIGGSIGIALRRRGWRVAYVDPHVSLDAARDAGAADARADGLDGDVVLLATPVDVAVAQLRTIESGALVTSVCSVMAPLREAASTQRFVAGHPLAGSHERGLAAARGELFEGKRWFADREDPRVAQLVADCGATLHVVNALEHDAALALTSHLPQLLSTALAAYVGEQHDLLDFAGTGLRTFLRLAGSDAAVWMPILAANRDAILQHASKVQSIVQRMLDGDASAFAVAQETMRRLTDHD